jgi:hypothetical protein
VQLHSANRGDEASAGLASRKRSRLRLLGIAENV